MVSYLFTEKGSRIFVGNTGGWSVLEVYFYKTWSCSKEMLLEYPSVNRKKTAGLEDTKAVYVEKLLKQYHEPGTGTCSHQPYSNVIYFETEVCHFKA